MSSTDFLQFIGIIVVFAIFIGTNWIQEQRRRTDLLRERVEKVLYTLAAAQKSLTRFVQEFDAIDWTDKSKLGRLERYMQSTKMGLADFVYEIQRFEILDKMYFEAFGEEHSRFHKIIELQGHAAEEGNIELMRKALKDAMNCIGGIQSRIVIEHATLTKSTHLPNEL